MAVRTRKRKTRYLLSGEERIWEKKNKNSPSLTFFFSPPPKKTRNKIKVACLAAILPLALYIGCQDEFAPEINPCSPGGYLRIARRTFAAFGSSESGKVTGKDL